MKNKKIKKWLAMGLAIIICGFPFQLGAVNIDRKEFVKPEEKISETVYAKLDSLAAVKANLSQEKIPVWVWYKDIDQKLIDREVTEQTGLTKDNLSSEYLMPEQNLLNALKQEEPNGKKLMEQYLEQTAVGRKLETQRTNEYVEKRRTLSRKKYEQKADAVIKQIALPDYDIQFKSKYTPAVIANMTLEEIKAASCCDDIEEISLFEDFEIKDCSLETQKETIQLNKVYSNLSLSGQGVKIGMIEQGIPYETPHFDMTNVFLVGNNLVEQGHALNTAKILKGEEGVAKNISLYATGGTPYPGTNVYSNLETLINLGI